MEKSSFLSLKDFELSLEVDAKTRVNKFRLILIRWICLEEKPTGQCLEVA